MKNNRDKKNTSLQLIDLFALFGVLVTLLLPCLCGARMKAQKAGGLIGNIFLPESMINKIERIIL